MENVVETMPSGGVSILGINIGVEDKSVAKEETITSHVYRVGENLGIEVAGGSLAANSYEYKVKPYYYWSKSGALVVDYMIDLNGEFWKENYITQDPGFLLPNRLDSLKVKNDIDKITNLEEYFMTPSILLNPAIPLKGDTVEVTAIVHNLSLSTTSDKVELSFYIGDPDNGGKLITDMKGKTLFITEEAIKDQDFAILKVKWIADFNSGDKIYGLIDPSGKLSENKEDNNKAWTPVQRFFDCNNPVSNEQIPYTSIDFQERFNLYPNPALDYINISYSGPDFNDLHVSVTDLNGRLHISEVFNYNISENSYNLDCSSLNTGMYLVTLTTQNYRQQSKVVVR